MKLFILTILSLLALTAYGFGAVGEQPPALIGSQLHEDSVAQLRQQLDDALALGLTAPASAAISTNFFNRILGQVSELINRVGRTIVIPGVSEKHFGFSPIQFSEFFVNSITVNTQAPNKIAVSINGLTIRIPNTGMYVKALIKCNGHMSANVEGATIAVTLTMGNDGRGHITTVASVTTSYRKISISHKFNSVICKVANSIINLLIGNIDKKIADAIKNELPKALGPAVTTAFDSMFAKIPLHFTGTPVVQSEGLAVTVDLLATTATYYDSVAPDDRLRAIESGLGDYNHDITISVPQNSMNNIMTVAHSQGKFAYTFMVSGNTSLFRAVMPNAYSACPDCQLSMGFHLSQAPKLIFENNDPDAAVHGISLSFAGRNAAGTMVPLFVMGCNISVDLDNLHIRVLNGTISNLHFQVGMKTLDLSTQSSSVGPLPALDIISPVITFCVKSLAIPAFNVAFTGVNFPQMFGNVNVKSLAGIFEFETNLILPPIA